MKKIQATIFSDNAPTATETIANGYALGQWWQINGTGKKYYHKTDGVWVLVGDLLADTTLQTEDTPEGTSLFSFWKIGVGRLKIAWSDLLNTISHSQLRGLDWLSSGHTGNANKIFGSGASGEAKEYDLSDFGGAKEKRHAFVSGTSYCGTAPAGTAENATIWTLAKIVVAANGTTTVTHATGSWINHLTANYL